MSKASIKTRTLRAKAIYKQRGITQQDIAIALGASQSQVSRVLSGQLLNRSRLLEEICLYAERMDVGVTAEAVRANDSLVESLRETWDGSASHAAALSAVIRSLAVLGPSVLKPEVKKASQ